jgi:hypothetical protein
MGKPALPALLTVGKGQARYWSPCQARRKLSLRCRGRDGLGGRSHVSACERMTDALAMAQYVWQSKRSQRTTGALGCVVRGGAGEKADHEVVR